ncbi:hypothetical protein AgCh_034118 [Apium graveolens]
MQLGRSEMYVLLVVVVELKSLNPCLVAQEIITMLQEYIQVCSRALVEDFGLVEIQMFFARQWLFNNQSSGVIREWLQHKQKSLPKLDINSEVDLWSSWRVIEKFKKAEGTQLSMQSPGFIIEPYTRREPIAFWRRCFTRSGWRRTKEDVILELKSAYAISKLRKKGYSKQKFYTEAFNLYKEINSQIATRDKASLRKAVTENMYSTLKNEIKQRQSVWSSVYLELIEPAVKIRTLRARMIALDKDDLRKFFIQLTLEFLTKQKFEAYDSSGSIVAGDKDKEENKIFTPSKTFMVLEFRLTGGLRMAATGQKRDSLSNPDTQSANSSHSSGATGGNQRNGSMMASNSELFGSNVPFQLTSHKLNGHNYLEWAQRMKLAIGGRGKLGLLNGETIKSAEGDPSLSTWKSENSLIIAWLINSL